MHEGIIVIHIIHTTLNFVHIAIYLNVVMESLFFHTPNSFSWAVLTRRFETVPCSDLTN